MNANQSIKLVHLSKIVSFRKVLEPTVACLELIESTKLFSLVSYHRGWHLSFDLKIIFNP